MGRAAAFGVRQRATAGAALVRTFRHVAILYVPGRTPDCAPRGMTGAAPAARVRA
jgi:hypothetical protein